MVGVTIGGKMQGVAMCGGSVISTDDGWAVFEDKAVLSYMSKTKASDRDSVWVVLV